MNRIYDDGSIPASQPRISQEIDSLATNRVAYRKAKTRWKYDSYLTCAKRGRERKAHLRWGKFNRLRGVKMLFLERFVPTLTSSIKFFLPPNDVSGFSGSVNGDELSSEAMKLEGLGVAYPGKQYPKSVYSRVPKYGARAMRLISFLIYIYLTVVAPAFSYENENHSFVLYM